MTTDKLNTDILNRFIEYLQGEYIPPDWNIKDRPNLNLKQAWDVVYMLQEWIKLIPDNFELCSECEQIFDIDDNGFYAGDDEEQINDNIEAGYNISIDDIGKFFCSGCR